MNKVRDKSEVQAISFVLLFIYKGIKKSVNMIV